MRYQKVQMLGGRGAGQGQFTSTLYSLTMDTHDRLYAAGDSEIKVFDRRGKLERRWPTAKPCYAVGVAANRLVFAGEKGQVEIFDPTGKVVDTWRDAQLLGRVSAIGFHKESVLIGDAAHRSIRNFEKGVYRNTIGANNRTSGLLIPNGAVSFGIDADGVIHAANPGKHRVERYTVSDRLLGHIGRFGNDPAGFPGCCNPTNVAVAGRDRIYVTEKAGPRVKAYDFQGNLISVIAADDFDPNCKNMPIAVNGRGLVYVADTVRLQILAFSPEG
jgi:sugar lactone lactonase YvrE